ncbi:MAG: hypothetical protein R2710_15300 [Acidimicrobiales bacterium]
MLLINKTEAGKAVADLHLEREDLAIEVAAIVDQLAKLRGDAVQLLSDSTELTVEVAALRAKRCVRCTMPSNRSRRRGRASCREIEALRRRHDDVVIEESSS